MIRRYHSWYIHELSQGYESWKAAIHLIFYLFKLSLEMSYYQGGHELLQFSQDVILCPFFLQNQSIGGSNEPPDERSPAPAAHLTPQSIDSAKRNWGLHLEKIIRVHVPLDSMTFLNSILKDKILNELPLFNFHILDFAHLYISCDTF